MTQAQQAEALHRSGMIALRLSRKGDKKAAGTIRALQARIAELEAEVNAERRHHGIRNASAVRTLHALGYSWRGADAWQPPAPQAAVPLPLLVRDIARDLGITVPQACIALKPLGNYSTNSAVTAEMARMLRDHFPAPVHPAEGVPAQAVSAEVDLPDVEDMAHSALQEALSFGLGHDVLNRWMRKVMTQTQAALAATQPAAQGMEALPMQASEGVEDVAVMEHPEWMLVHKETGAQKPLDSQWTVRAAQPAAQGAATTGYIAPKGRYVPPVLFSPYTGEPRDARDIASDPRGILIVPPGAALAAQAKQGGAA